MTQQIAPYVLVGMDALMLVGGVWLLARALKTWRTENRRTDSGILATEDTDRDVSRSRIRVPVRVARG